MAQHAQCDVWEIDGPPCTHGLSDCDQVIMLRHIAGMPDYFATGGNPIRMIEVTTVSATGTHRTR